MYRESMGVPRALQSKRVHWEGKRRNASARIICILHITHESISTHPGSLQGAQRQGVQLLHIPSGAVQKFENRVNLVEDVERKYTSRQRMG